MYPKVCVGWFNYQVLCQKYCWIIQGIVWTGNGVLGRANTEGADQKLSDNVLQLDGHEIELFVANVIVLLISVWSNLKTLILVRKRQPLSKMKVKLVS